MQESTKSKLIVFSRLWAVPMVLFVLLAVAAVIAGMNEHRGWMGLCVVGTILMLIVQLAQLVNAIIMRRWWCVAGAVFGVGVSVFVALTSIVALGAGQWRAPEIHAQDNSCVVNADTLSFSQTDEQLSCNIVVLMPDEDVRQSVGEWLNMQFGNTYTGNMTDLQALVNYYGNSHLDSLRSSFEEGVPDFAEPCYDASMELLLETDKVVTYGLTITLDLGGTHPVTRELGATFNKEDGKQLTWDIVRSDSQSQLRDILCGMLKDYFNVKNDGELMDCLQGVDDVATIPLPTTPPYMTLEGFTLIYQQYEIASYAAGMPSDVIPYEQMKGCLTEYAQELIPEDYSFPVNYQGKAPTISDFFVAISTMEDPGEWLIYLRERWKEYRRGDKYEGHFTVENSRGYLRYDEEETNDDGVVRTGFSEFCYWICDDNRHYIVAETCNTFENGVAIDGQYGGITMFLFDSKTRRMLMVPDWHFGLERPDVNAIIGYSLPSEGKDITATVYDTEKGEYPLVYVWNGNGFDLEN
jgi:hypothetical protein